MHRKNIGREKILVNLAYDAQLAQFSLPILNADGLLSDLPNLKI